MGPLKYLFSGVRLLTVLSVIAIVGGVVLQGEDITQTVNRLSESPSHLQGWIRGQGFLVSQADCSGQEYPNWPDCETIECISGGYSCTKMKEGSSGGSSGGGGSCEGSPPTSSSWCDYSTSPPQWKESSGGGGTWCSGSPPTSSSWCENGVWKESSGGSGGGCRDMAGYNNCLSSGRSMSDCESAYCWWGGSSGGGCETSPAGCGGGGTWGGSGGGWNGSGGAGGGAMKRCFYPNASINGKHPGYTVWCAEDYVDCHEGSPSGKSIPTTGLQLGAPSQCESGWNTGSTGGAGGQWGGGWTGGGDSGDACRRGCETAPTMPECKTTNPPQWCKTPVDQCKAACGQAGSTGGGATGMNCREPAAYNECVKTKPMSECDRQYCWYQRGDAGTSQDAGTHPSAPNPMEQLKPVIDKPLAKAQCARDPKTGLLSYMNATIKGWTVLPKNDCESAGLHPGQMQEWHPAPEDKDRFPGDMGSNGDFMGDLGGYGGQNGGNPDIMMAAPPRPEFKTQDIERQKQDALRNLKQREREIKDMRRSLKNNPDNAVLSSKIDAFEQGIAQTRTCLEFASDFDAMDCYDIEQDTNDLAQEIWPMLQAGNLGRDLKQQEKEFKNMEREIARLIKKEQDTSDLISILDDIKSIRTEVQTLLSTDPDEAQYRMQDVWDLQRDFWDTFQSRMEDQWKGGDCRDAERGLADADRAINNEAPRMIEKVRVAHPDIAVKMETLLQKAKDILQKGRAALKNESCDQAIDAVDTLHHDISQKFDDLMRQAGVDDEFGSDDFDQGFGKFDYNDAYDDFNFDENELGREDFVRHLSDQKYDAGALSLAKRIAAEVLEQYFKNQKDSGTPDIITSTADLGVSTLEVQKLLEVKNSLLSEIESLRAEVKGLKDELVAIANQVQQFTFGEKTGKEAEDFVKNELPNLTAEEAAKRFAELKEAAGEELYNDNVIPFEDTYVGDWYTAHAKKARALGLVEGTGDSDGRKLDPARDTNVAETIMMFARLAGVDEDAVPASDIGTNLPDWAKPAAGTLENMGVDLDAIFGNKDAGDTATRGEVAVLLDAVLDLSDADATIANRFTDIRDADDKEHDSIAAVYDAGIMTGYGDSKEFGVNDPLNRAALVKILNLSHDAFGDVNHDKGLDINQDKNFDDKEKKGTEVEASTSIRTRVRRQESTADQGTTVDINASGGRRMSGNRPSNRTR